MTLAAERYLPRAAIEELTAKGLLQTAHLQADGGLRERDFIGGSGK